MIHFKLKHVLGVVLGIGTGVMAGLFLGASDATATTGPLQQSTLEDIAEQLQVGDVVFTRIKVRPFLKVAAATGSWTNHVGIVTDISGSEPQISESTFPLSRTTPLSKFVARSESGRVAVARLKTEISPEQQTGIRQAAKKRSGILYDTGFNLHSSRQFCSRFVREVLAESTGVHVGKVENFATLLAQRPDTDLGFWKLWYFGRIPWQRETVTPASILNSPALQIVFDGRAHTPTAEEVRKAVPPYPAKFEWNPHG
ncbi:Permuted papain-like amidase enzyme, YaeF/YiiX, C92 family [Formivibrio citricus]|uniref:Permuted papain-like amidase enzyme, YaeF/YiiX, C92 family n=1 Tax=Formivibrio citricus TaxID=83765 RepID=A0A1I4YMG8_9NEIS|nr:YebB family permuted papain-like enzyme [Formivibrio citricus]SFN39177.1 Permuted papain-like amidase enzyme, YaeF/YiiX, C92 family [Formivibrio citricus]